MGFDPLRILFVVPYAPTQVRVRPHNFLRQLHALGHEVTLLTLYSSAEEQQFLATRPYRVIAEPLPRWRTLRNSLQALPTRQPLQYAYCWQPKLLRQVEPTSFDVVHVEHLRGAKFGMALQERFRPIIWDSVDSITYLFEQATQHSRSLFGRYMTRFELPRTRRMERQLVQQFDHALVTAEIDATKFRQLVPQLIQNKLSVLPNGVDLALFRPTLQNTLRSDGQTVIFSGKMSYHANVTMAISLIEEIMPIVWRKRPGTQLKIVGQHPPNVLRRYGRLPHIVVTGRVPSLAAELQHGTVAAVPMRYGAGIQNKVLEAMACGLPIVVSQQAVAGLSADFRDALCVAESAEQFAKKIIGLLDNPTERHQLGDNARRYVTKHHNWESITHRLTDIYRKAIEEFRVCP